MPPILHTRCESSPWLIFESFYAIFDYLLCCNKFLSATVRASLLVPFLNLSHFNALSCEKVFSDVSIAVRRRRMALNYLICYYEIIILSNWTYSSHTWTWQNIINFNLFSSSFVRSDDKFCAESADNLFYYFVWTKEEESLKRFPQCSQNPLILDSQSLSYFVMLCSSFPSPQIQRLPLFDKWLI